MDVVALIGRILFVIVFLGSGFTHLANTEAMAGYAASKKLPAAKLMVLGGGVWIAVAGLMVIVGLWVDLAALMLAAFVLTTAAVMHNFWTQADPDTQQAEMTQFLKDVGLGGGALLLFVLYGGFGDQMGLTATDPLFF